MITFGPLLRDLRGFRHRKYSLLTFLSQGVLQWHAIITMCNCLLSIALSNQSGCYSDWCIFNSSRHFTSLSSFCGSLGVYERRTAILKVRRHICNLDCTQLPFAYFAMFENIAHVEPRQDF